MSSGLQIATVATNEGAAFGASLLAAVGAGWFTTVSDAAAWATRLEVAAEPGADREVYAEAIRGYRAAVSRPGADLPRRT